MSRFAARALAVGLALSGGLLVTTGVPAVGGPGQSPAAGAGAPDGELAATSSISTGTPDAPPAPVSPSRATASVSTVTTLSPASRPAAARPGACAGPGWEQRRGAAALASLRPAAGNGYSLRFAGAKEGFYGLTRPSLSAVEVYVRSCAAESDELLRHVLAHELGHAYDKTRLTDAQRAAYKAARGIPASTPWYGCDRCTDFATPAGDFAEVYSQWRRGADTNRSQLGGAPSPAELDALAVRFFGTP